jgi:hypothetical protein
MDARDVDADAERFVDPDDETFDETDDEVEAIVDLPPEGSPADVIDQHRVVPLDDPD